MIQMNISFEAQVKLISNVGVSLYVSLRRGIDTCCFIVGCRCDGLAKQENFMNQRLRRIWRGIVMVLDFITVRALLGPLSIKPPL